MSPTERPSLDELKALHAVQLPEGYTPYPDAHLKNPRDAGHFNFANEWLRRMHATTALDVGCYDGWLDFLLTSNYGYHMSGHELIPELAEAARRYASRNFIDYNIAVGPAIEVDDRYTYDAVLCFETLEHMPFEDACFCMKKFQKMARRGVLISLPDQDCRLNKQHRFTPTEALIRQTWGDWPWFRLHYRSWTGTDIPGNWFVEVGGTDAASPLY